MCRRASRYANWMGQSLLDFSPTQPFLHHALIPTPHLSLRQTPGSKVLGLYIVYRDCRGWHEVPPVVGGTGVGRLQPHMTLDRCGNSAIDINRDCKTARFRKKIICLLEIEKAGCKGVTSGVFGSHRMDNSSAVRYYAHCTL